MRIGAGFTMLGYNDVVRWRELLFSGWWWIFLHISQHNPSHCTRIIISWTQSLELLAEYTELECHPCCIHFSGRNP